MPFLGIYALFCRILGIYALFCRLGIYALFCRIFGDLRTFLSNFVATDIYAVLLKFWFFGIYTLFVYFLGIYVLFCRYFGDIRTFWSNFVATDVYALLLKSLPRLLFPILVWHLGLNLSSTPGSSSPVMNWWRVPESSQLLALATLGLRTQCRFSPQSHTRRPCSRQALIYHLHHTWVFQFLLVNSRRRLPFLFNPLPFT